MKVSEQITAQGHKNILCTHKSTIELTKEKQMTKRGTCILGVNSTKACYDLNLELRNKIKSGAKVKVEIKIDDCSESFTGCGNESLTLKDEKDMVFRKSDYICDRTVLIKCSKAAFELDQYLIEKLKKPGKHFTVTLEIDE